MWPHNSNLIPALLAFCLVVTGVGHAEEASQEAEKPQFLRVVRDAKDVPTALQVAIVRCVPIDCGQKTPTVDLVSAVHIADKDYYDTLNQQFKQYDAVLYELVARKGVRIPKGGPKPSGHPIGFMQKSMTSILKLEYQLEGVDYSKDHFVHADMTPAQFARTMQSRGESFMQMYVRMFNFAMKQQSSGETSPSGGNLLFALLSKDRALPLKRAMADQFEDMEASISAINGPDGSTIISERNRVALKILRKQIKKGKQNLAIFYGAGHMSDFLVQLKNDFGFVPVETQWITAWDLDPLNDTNDTNDMNDMKSKKSVGDVPAMD